MKDKQNNDRSNPQNPTSHMNQKNQAPGKNKSQAQDKPIAGEKS